MMLQINTMMCGDGWYGIVEVCEGAPVAVSGWVLTDRHDLALWYGMVWYGMVWYGHVQLIVCIGKPYPLIMGEGAPVAVSGWVLTDRHDLAPCAANSLHRETISVSNVIGGTGTLGIA